MTENNIIEGLEALMNIIKLSDEKYICTSTEMLAGALNCIYNLKAEKEGLIAGQESLQKALAAKIAESEKQSQNFKVLVSDHKTLQQSFDNLKGLYKAEKTKVEKAKEKCIGFAKELQTAKAELKEITEKFNCQQYVYADLSKIIKEQAEELKTSKAEIERLKLITTNKPYCVSIGTADIFTENHEEYEWLLARISAEAIKEFAKRLKQKIECDLCYGGASDYLRVIDKIKILVKEMVGEG